MGIIRVHAPTERKMNRGGGVMKTLRHAFIVHFVCLLGAIMAGEQKKNLDDPMPRKEAIVKLFAEEFVPITPGKDKFPESFMMGSEKDGHDNERPAHKVTFKYSFAMARYEVTQELLQVVMATNPSEFRGLRNGADRVQWQEANDFCAKATKLLREQKLIAANDQIRLPSGGGNGNTAAGPGRRPLSRLATTSPSWASTAGTRTILRAMIRRSARSCPTPGAFTTCTATSGNGAWIAGTPITRTPPPTARLRPLKASKGPRPARRRLSRSARHDAVRYRHHADSKTRARRHVGFRCVKARSQEVIHQAPG